MVQQFLWFFFSGALRPELDSKRNQLSLAPTNGLNRTGERKFNNRGSYLLDQNSSYGSQAGRLNQ